MSLVDGSWPITLNRALNDSSFVIPNPSEKDNKGRTAYSVLKALEENINKQSESVDINTKEAIQASKALQRLKEIVTDRLKDKKANVQRSAFLGK